MKRIIVTGDDFGLSAPVNEAIERAHRQGILNTTSLMVGAPAAADAVERARRLPGLRVGLHLVVARGRPVLPPSAIPDLVERDGVFTADLLEAGLRYFFKRVAREQLAREIRAQFEAFASSGLPLDHVNGHNHMHIHPTVFGLVLRIGREFGLRAIRLPHEPLWASWRATGDGLLARLAWQLVAGPWIALMRQRIARAGLASNAFVFGVADSGRMNRERVLKYLDHLPDGVSEIYFHPGAASKGTPESAAAEGDAELAALTDLSVASALRKAGIQLSSFADLVPFAGSQRP